MEERFQAVCIDDNKTVGKVRFTKAQAQIDADAHTNSEGHQTEVRSVFVSSKAVMLVEQHQVLKNGEMGEIVSGPFANEIVYINFKNDNLKFRKVHTSKLEIIE